MTDNPSTIDFAALEDVNRLIRSRRTIKPASMRSDPVPRALLDAILENANWAPTHGQTEPWRFKIFQGDARRKLADSLAEIYREVTPEESFRPEKLEKLKTNPLLAPVVIAICMNRQALEKIPEIEEIEAVACAVHNMHLTASALRLAAFWSSPPIIYSGAMKEFLGLDPKDACLGIFYLGWPREDFAWPEGARRPIADKILWES